MWVISVLLIFFVGGVEGLSRFGWRTRGARPAFSFLVFVLPATWFYTGQMTPNKPATGQGVSRGRGALDIILLSSLMPTPLSRQLGNERHC